MNLEVYAAAADLCCVLRIFLTFSRFCQTQTQSLFANIIKSFLKIAVSGLSYLPLINVNDINSINMILKNEWTDGFIFYF